MGYTLAILGCGTMGIAVTSGVINSLNLRPSSSSSANNLSSSISSLSAIPLTTASHSHLNNNNNNNNNNHQSGTSTPTSALDAPEESLPSRFIATCMRPETGKKLKRVFREMGGLGEEVEVIVGNEANLKAMKEADVVLICVKPQMVATVTAQVGFAEAIAGKTVISICAGVTLAQLKSYLPESCTVVRAMPNTPAKIQQGMTIITTIPNDPITNTPTLTHSILLSLFSSCGLVRFIDEKHFDVCTALAGSGPAFVALMLEALADGAVMMGLPREEAVLLAAQTIQGTGRMVLESGLHPAQLKDSVTTPGGCTIAGLLTLEDGRVRSTIARTIQVATNHAAGLGQDKKK